MAKKELPKINLLAPKRYVLVTSLPLNPADKERIAAAVNPHIQKSEDILGAEDLNNLLGLFPLIEQQHFKLWLSSTAVLDRVLHNAEKVQTEFDVERIQKMIPKYGQTSSYPKAMKILDEHRSSLSLASLVSGRTLANILL